jgi:phasin
MTDSFSLAGGAFPGFPFQVPEALRSIAENGVTQARAGYAMMRDAAETGNEAIEAVLETATRGAGTYAERVLELSRANTQAALDFSVALMGAGSLSEAFELVGGQARCQIETFLEQSRELAELGQQVASATLAPIRVTPSKALTSAG